MNEDSKPINIPNEIYFIKKRDRALSHPSPPDVKELRKIQEHKYPTLSKFYQESNK